MNIFYRLGENSCIMMTKGMIASSDDAIVFIELNMTDSKYYLHVWFKGEYKEKASLLEEQLNERGIEYHSPTHDPDCMVLSQFATFDCSKRSAIIASPRVKNLSGDSFQSFIGYLMEFLELGEFQKPQFKKLLSDPEYYQAN